MTNAERIQRNSIEYKEYIGVTTRRLYGTEEREGYCLLRQADKELEQRRINNDELNQILGNDYRGCFCFGSMEMRRMSEI